MRHPFALMMLAALGGCIHGPSQYSRGMALDDVLAFADPARCEPGPAQTKLLAAMVGGDANDGFRAGRLDVPRPHSQAFGAISLERRDHYTVIALPLRGTLFGLPITSIEQSLPEGGDPGEVHYRFASAPETVERVFVSRGFPVKLGSAVQLGPPEVYEHVIELVPDPVRPGHALVTCGYR